MNDRRRLLALSVLILTGVSLAAMAATAWQLLPTDPYAASAAHSFQLALGSTAVMIFAGATLLLRVAQPLLRRLEESEARMRAIIETAVDGIVTFDADGIVRSCNPAGERLFGCQASALVGGPIEACIEPSPLKRLRADECDPAECDPSASRTGRGEWQAAGRRRGGRLFPLELSVGEYRQNGRPHYAAFVRDITDRKQAEEQTRIHVERLQAATSDLEVKAAELARANQELDDFTYVASHDLKEPLRGISSYCGILLEEYQDQLDDNGRRMMSTLVALCQRLERLIDDLLTYSRLGRAPELAPVDLDEVLDTVLETLGPAIDGRGGVVRRAGRLPTALADATTIALVLQNLISNGLKFNESRTPEVEIGCSEGDALTIYVRDNGIGIDPRRHEAVFAMFRRLHSRRKYEGAGAGLTIVRKIVEAHGGRVWLESSPGCGSTFSFTLAPAPNEDASMEGRAPSPVYNKEGRAPSPVNDTEGRAPSPVYNKEGRAPSPVEPQPGEGARPSITEGARPSIKPPQPSAVPSPNLQLMAAWAAERG
ncbi:MAG TPA: ATP-binding protein [Pirellulales bacterium]|nr:ATP-binding protein [Pirellulales bacterium]